MDGDFLPDGAEELLKRREMLKVPVMMGITNHEFGWILPQVTHTSNTQTNHSLLGLCDDLSTLPFSEGSRDVLT